VGARQGRGPGRRWPALVSPRSPTSAVAAANAPQRGRHSRIPPLSQGYKELYSRKWSYTRELAASIQAGLQKMVEAKEDVNKMKAELAVKNQASPNGGRGAGRIQV
jgi:hypothetical protein